ncbi:MAG: Tetratricopeptide 2 repeat protein [Bryobacterales bacterium]|nr:Tetratricopeptide 2 repeat protein [Bryobacterales bacterium]
MNRNRACGVPLLLIAACVSVEGQSTPLDQAWALAAKGERAQAINVARSIAKREPRNADVHLFLGSLLVEEGQGPEAIDQLTEAVRLRPNSSEAWNALGEAYNAFGDSKNAREPFEQAVRLNPKFGVAQANLGAVLLHQGEPAAAATHLDTAIRLLGRSPDAGEPHYLRARICTVMGQTEDAATHLEQAVALRPDFAEAWSDLGQARKARLDTAGALAAYERAVKLNPDDAVAQYRLGAEYLHQDQLVSAITHLQAAYQLAPDDQSTLNALQTALRQNGQMEEAAAVKQKLTEVLRNRDQKSQLALKALKLNNQGADLERTGKLQEAVEKYREALDLQPDHNGFRVNYAVALLRTGHWTDGLNQLHEALQRHPDDHDIQVALKDALSQAPPDTLPAWAMRAQPATQH